MRSVTLVKKFNASMDEPAIIRGKYQGEIFTPNNAMYTPLFAL
ncbi:hypothetical protein [uncultured Methanospirillum sp.]|nr:hypothetical protein [uncultured Methanospirillum sp.]